LLAAGSGRRYGTPKALVDTGSGPWVLRALSVMSGCDEVTVVVGADGDRVADLLPAGVPALSNADHQTGMGSSLAVGLREVAKSSAAAVLVMLVDLPDVTREVLDRVALHARTSATPESVLARAAYQGRPGHPVLIGRDHFDGVIAGSVGDSGARDYLASHQVVLVECGDLAGGRDVDTPAGP
jgi:CTP:molybdopterin cytidylyltransferase MocA